MNAGLLLIIVFFGLMYILFLRPQRRRRMDQSDMLGNLAVGDEIVTAGGVYGVIQRVGDDDLSIEIAPGVEIRVAKRAVAGIVEQPADDEDEADEQDADEEDDEGAEANEPEAAAGQSEEPEKPAGRS